MCGQNLLDWLFGKRKGKMTRPQGIDISKYQESFDPGIASEPIDFIIQRASWGKYRDEEFVELFQGVKEIERRGAYHYYSSNIPWKEQADLFLEISSGKGFKALVVDYEKGYNKLTQRTALELASFLAYLKAQRPNKRILGYSNFYCYRDLIMPYVDLSMWDWFFARYPSNPDPQKDDPQYLDGMDPEKRPWKKWQYSSTGDGSKYGVESTFVDLVVFNGNYDDLDDYFNINQDPPTPPPPPPPVDCTGQIKSGQLEVINQAIAALNDLKAEIQDG